MREALRSKFEQILPAAIFRFLFIEKYAHFFFTGVSGLLINLLITWSLTTFVFGVDKYFTAYLIAVTINLAYNFALHFIVTFRAKSHVLERMIGFIAYSFSMTAFQAWLIKIITPIIGLQYYLLVISSVIFVFSIVTFLLFKYFLFRSDEKQMGRYPQLLYIAIFTSLVIHITGLLEVWAHNGLAPLLSGDATGYLELAKNLWSGNGFVALGSDGILGPEYFRTPGVPLILAPFMGFAFGLKLFLILQTFLSAILLPILIFEIGKRIFSERAGLIAAWLIALEPQIAFSSWSPLTEIPALVSGLLGVLLFLSLRGWVGCRLCFWTRALLAGVSFGFVVLVRPSLLMFIAFFFVGYLIADALRKNKKEFLRTVLIGLIAFMVILPWLSRNFSHTGAFSMSGTGWWNAYVDYGASISVIENKVEFSAERMKRKEEAARVLGLDAREELNSPAYSSALRDMAINDIREHWKTVLKMEPVFLISYFTNDNYYNQFIRFGFVAKIPDRASPTQTFIREGIAGIPRIIEELRKQYFIPLLSRLYQFAILFLAFWGWWKVDRNTKILLAVIIGFAAISGTVIGLGIAGRIRIPIMPMLFLLAAHGIVSGFPKLSFFRKKSQEVLPNP